jgi:hypothetical protein
MGDSFSNGLEMGWGRISENTSKIRGPEKNLKKLERSYRYYPGMCPKELRKTKKSVSQKSWSTGLELPGLSIIL